MVHISIPDRWPNDRHNNKNKDLYWVMGQEFPDIPHDLKKIVIVADGEEMLLLLSAMRRELR